jgi:SAM-dependent methyltransferase
MSSKIARWLHFNLRYLGQPPWDTGVSPPELIAYLQKATPGRALDVGCGTGTNLLSMASFGWTVVGIDLAWLSVLKARAKLKKAGFAGRVIHGDVSGKLDPGAGFDLILDIGCYHSLNHEEREAYHQNLARWLGFGGTYLLYAHLTTSAGDAHGISDDDYALFSNFMLCQWRKDSDERRPDGGGGFPATWALFKRRIQGLRV